MLPEPEMDSTVSLCLQVDATKPLALIEEASHQIQAEPQPYQETHNPARKMPTTSKRNATLTCRTESQPGPKPPTIYMLTWTSFSVRSWHPGLTGLATIPREGGNHKKYHKVQGLGFRDDCLTD